MLGGRSIGKYVIIAAAIAAVAFGIWTAVHSYNKAIADNARKSLQLKQSYKEVRQSNEDKKQLAGMLAAERDRTRAAQQLARARARRANATSVALTHILNTAGSPAVAKFERMLVEQLERGQGYKFDSNTSPDTASKASVPAPFIPFACFDKTTARAMIHNAMVAADYIDDVELAAKPNGVQNKAKEDKRKINN